MIDLTPLEVRQKKGDFRRSMRGYDAELVDDFLDLVADRMEELVKQNMALQDRVGALEVDLDAFKAKERALSDALMAAQKLREDARSHAEREGELLVREARQRAEAARDEATRQLAREEEALRQVRARRAQLVQSFRRLLEREMDELTVIEEALELRTGRGGTSHARRAPAAGPDASAAGGSGGKAGSGKAGSGKAAGRGGGKDTGAPAGEAGKAGKGGEAGEAGEGGAGAGGQEDWLASLMDEEQPGGGGS